MYIISTYPDTGLGDVCGWAQPADPLNPTGDINLYMGTEPSPSMILDTDYESFVASYSCENNPFELTHRTSAGIDTRDPIPSQEIVRIFFNDCSEHALLLVPLSRLTGHWKYSRRMV